jgi:hypothetical protein
MIDSFPDLDPWEAYELACKRIAELEAERNTLQAALKEIRGLHGENTEACRIADRALAHAGLDKAQRLTESEYSDE